MTQPSNVWEALRAGLGSLAGRHILIVMRGSVAHGLWVPPSDPVSTDDVDAAAILALPPSYYIGLDSFASKGTKEIKIGEWDVVVYDVLKAVRLLAAGNPNMLSLLWADEPDIKGWTPEGRWLVTHRNLFSSKRVYKAMAGYAAGQLHRMERSNTDEAYMGAKRKALVGQFGYDTKNAAHCIRLLRMAEEFLRTGVLRVKRTTDREELLAIKRGEWSLDAVKAAADEHFAAVKQALAVSPLPDEPDHAAINRLAERIIRESWSRFDDR